jgi:hypothetical protein
MAPRDHLDADEPRGVVDDDDDDASDADSAVADGMSPLSARFSRLVYELVLVPAAAPEPSRHAHTKERKEERKEGRKKERERRERDAREMREKEKSETRGMTPPEKMLRFQRA